MVGKPMYKRCVLEVTDVANEQHFQVEYWMIKKTLSVCIYSKNSLYHECSGTWSKFSQIQKCRSSAMWIRALNLAGICSRPNDDGLEFVSVRDARKLATTLIALRRRGVSALERLDKHVIFQIARYIQIKKE